MRSRLRGFALALATSGSFWGCSEPTTGTVFGTVAVGGAPVETGAITFIPENLKGRTTGAEIADGRYRTTSSLGRMRVEIRVPRVVGQKKLYDAPDSPMKAILEETIPARYHDESTLTIEVLPGNNERDFELELK
ncbi:MAG: hypothetical protein KF688_05585 [Pirellulales bacterium]|nr:hypothetical protein [Pirellulales bacterium]